MRILVLVTSLFLSLLTAGCSGPSAEYTADAEALLKQMESTVAEFEQGSHDGADTMAVAKNFLKVTTSGETGLTFKAGEFERKWDAKGEGELESFKLILEAKEQFSKAREAITEAYYSDEANLQSVFMDSATMCGASVAKARRFFNEGK